MERLRHARRLAAWVLAFFVLAMGAASAAPWVQPVVYEPICSAEGTRYVAHEQGDSTALERHGAKCALCVLLAPPPVLAAVERHAPVARQALGPAGDWPLAPSHAAAPPPARGPPPHA